MSVRRRGVYGFSVTGDGKLVDGPENADLLRRLWIGREFVSDDLLGPGDPGDFDFGAWHVSCHVVAAGGVMELDDGALAWLEISYDQAHDRYYPSFTVETDSTFTTIRLNSQAANERLADARVLGFVEGTSLGRISARDVHDPEARFNGNPRQEYDEPPDSGAEGGKVWEHWCTLRDIRDSATIASSVLAAYVTLCAHLGDLFPSCGTALGDHTDPPEPHIDLLHAGDRRGGLRIRPVQSCLPSTGTEKSDPGLASSDSGTASTVSDSGYRFTPG